MDLTSQRIVSVSELDYRSLTIDNQVLLYDRGDFTVSLLELAIAVGRTSVSKNLSDMKKELFATSALALLLGIVNDSSSKLLLTEESKDYFRDFSKASRIGEIAQGLNCLYFRKVMGYPEFNDFTEYAINRCPDAALDKSTPDFVMSSISGKDVIIMESKGSWNSNGINNLKSAIRKGVNQSVKGFDWLNEHDKNNPINKTFISCAWLRDRGITDIYYIDPSFSNNGKLDYKFTLYHFASWFYFIGLCDIADNLKEGHFINLQSSNHLIRYIKEINGVEYVIFSRKYTNKNYLNCIVKVAKDELLLEFGISRYIWEYLTNKNNNTRTLDRKRVYNNIKPFSNRELTLFADGTVILYSL